MDTLQIPSPEIDAFEVASQRLEHAYNAHIRQPREMKPAFHLSSMLCPAARSLDHLVSMVDAVAEVRVQNIFVPLY